LGHFSACLAILTRRLLLYFSYCLIKCHQYLATVLSFVALADPTRRAIVEMLARGPLTSGEIARRFTISPSAVSQHLRVLRDARLVRARAAGQQRIYELDADGLAEIEEWLDGIGPAWRKRLEAIERQRRLEAASPR
jgi:DNA-binding transcriptional ArsR family regulator